MITALVSRIRSIIDGLRFRGRARALERALANAPAADRAPILQDLGDLHAGAGSDRAALRYFGAAIDALLAGERFDAAAALCRKVLRLYPDTVRARGTLGLLLLGRGHARDAEHELGRYLDAARAVGSAGYAAERLRMMGEALPEPAARTLLGSLLRTLGAPPELAPPAGRVQRASMAAVLRRPVTPQRVDVHAAPGERDAARASTTEDLPWLDVSVDAGKVRAD